jgi:urocanate hydratase
VALSGDPQDIYPPTEAILELFPEDEHLVRWIRMAQKKVRFQGLAGAHLLAGLWRAGRAGLLFNEMVRTRRGERAHRHRPRPSRLRLGGQPNRETEGMRDGSDACRRLADSQRAPQLPWAAPPG